MWHTHSHGLFTKSRHRLGEDTYLLVFDRLLWRLLERGVVKGDINAIDGTHVNAYSLRSLNNRTDRSYPEARFSRGKRAQKKQLASFNTFGN